MHIKNRKILLFALIVLIIVVIKGIWGISYKEQNAEIEETIQKNNNNKSNAFAIMIGELDGSYTEYTENNWPLEEDGYLFNQSKSLCINANGDVIDKEIIYGNNMVKMTTSEAMQCYLYFERVSEGDYCSENGIYNLKECLLRSENYSDTLSNSITNITNKGIATYNEVSPTMKYYPLSEIVSNENGINALTTTMGFTLGSSYIFNEDSGEFEIKNGINIAKIQRDRLNPVILDTIIPIPAVP